MTKGWNETTASPEGAVFQVGVAALVLAAFTASWNGVQVFGQQLVDLCLTLAFMAFVLEVAGRSRLIRLPRWLTVFAIVIATITVSHAIAAVELQLSVQQVVKYEGQSNLAVGGKWLVAVLAIPYLTLFFTRAKFSVLRTVLVAWALGAAVSSAIGLSDFLGLTDVSNQLLGGASLLNRQAGLTSQANNLAAAAAITTPVLIWYARSGGWRRPLAIGAILVNAAGCFASGSRGGAVAFLVALLVGLMVVAGRAARVNLALAAALATGLVVSVVPAVRESLERTFRVGESASLAAQSDAGRGILANQAWGEFTASPLRGVGMQVAFEAHSIYLQLVSAGGLVLGVGFAIFAFGTLRSGLLVSRQSIQPTLAGFGSVLLISAMVWWLFGAIENQLTDRYLYFPIAGIIAVHRLTFSRDVQCERVDVTGHDGAGRDGATLANSDSA